MNAWTLAPDDARYPRGLFDLTSPPVLRIRGALPSSFGIAIVGTRASSPEGEAFTFGLAQDLARAGVTIWSGGALGIDAAAHRGALAAGAPTVVVIGSGVARPTPHEHESLFEQVIACGGALVSRLDDEAPARTPHYHARNAVLAAATRLTLVIECGLRSGALSTARHATTLGRPVAFVPHAPWSRSGAGCLAAIKRGASVVVEVSDALALMGLTSAPGISTATTLPRQGELFVGTRVDGSAPEPFVIPADLSPLEAELVMMLEEAHHIDALCERLAKLPSALVPPLVTLALRGIVVEEAPGVFRRAR